MSDVSPGPSSRKTSPVGSREIFDNNSDNTNTTIISNNNLSNREMATRQRSESGRSDGIAKAPRPLGASDDDGDAKAIPILNEKPNRRSYPLMSMLDRELLLGALKQAKIEASPESIDSLYRLLHKHNYPNTENFIRFYRIYSNARTSAISSTRLSSRTLSKSHATTVSEDVLQFLGSHCVTITSTPHNVKRSANGCSLQFTTRLFDGHEVTTRISRFQVEGGGWKAAVSVASQTGPCRGGCPYCHHSIGADLTCHEILEQVVHARRILKSYPASGIHCSASKQDTVIAATRCTGPGEEIINVAFMSEGEALLNYENVLSACRVLANKKTWNLRKGHITISTSLGILPRIRKLQKDLPQTILCLNLDAPNQYLRSQMDPISKQYQLREVIEALDQYNKGPQNDDHKRAMIRYSMVEGETCTRESAHELGLLIRRRNLLVNLVPHFRVHKEDTRRCPSIHVMNVFQRILKSYEVSCSIRLPMGADIDPNNLVVLSNDRPALLEGRIAYDDMAKIDLWKTLASVKAESQRRRRKARALHNSERSMHSSDRSDWCDRSTKKSRSLGEFLAQSSSQANKPKRNDGTVATESTASTTRPDDTASSIHVCASEEESPTSEKSNDDALWSKQSAAVSIQCFARGLSAKHISARLREEHKLKEEKERTEAAIMLQSAARMWLAKSRSSLETESSRQLEEWDRAKTTIIQSVSTFISASSLSEHNSFGGNKFFLDVMVVFSPDHFDRPRKRSLTSMLCEVAGMSPQDNFINFPHQQVVQLTAHDFPLESEGQHKIDLFLDDWDQHSLQYATSQNTSEWFRDFLIPASIQRFHFIFDQSTGLVISDNAVLSSILLQTQQDHRLTAAVTLQCAARQKFANDQVQEMRQEKMERQRLEESAAVVIQSVARQKVAATVAKNMRYERQIGMVRQEEAAVVIQRTTRGRMIRLRREKEKRAEQDRHDMAVVTLQCAVRQRIANDQVVRMKEERLERQKREESAAIVIQGMAKQRSAVTIVDNLRYEERTKMEEQEATAVANQNSFNGNSSNTVELRTLHLQAEASVVTTAETLQRNSPGVSTIDSQTRGENQLEEERGHSSSLANFEDAGIPRPTEGRTVHLRYEQLPTEASGLSFDHHARTSSAMSAGLHQSSNNFGTWLFSGVPQTFGVSTVSRGQNNFGGVSRTEYQGDNGGLVSRDRIEEGSVSAHSRGSIWSSLRSIDSVGLDDLQSFHTLDSIANDLESWADDTSELINSTDASSAADGGREDDEHSEDELSSGNNHEAHDERRTHLGTLPRTLLVASTEVVLVFTRANRVYQSE